MGSLICEAVASGYYFVLNLCTLRIAYCIQWMRSCVVAAVVKKYGDWVIQFVVAHLLSLVTDNYNDILAAEVWW